MLITFEGIEGTGKSTQLKRLHEYLVRTCVPVKVYGQPGGTPIGEDIRTIFKKDYQVEMSSITEVLLLVASFTETDRQIRKDIEGGYVVLMDRWTSSLISYQGTGRSQGDLIETLLNLVPELYTPDITFTLTLDPAEMDRRLALRGTTDRIEQMGTKWFTTVQDSFKDLSNRTVGDYIIDASGTIDVVKALVLKQYREHLAY